MITPCFFAAFALETHQLDLGYWPHKSQGFHYHQNAGTYMQIGEVMGAAMVELQQMQ